MIVSHSLSATTTTLPQSEESSLSHVEQQTSARVGIRFRRGLALFCGRKTLPHSHALRRGTDSTFHRADETFSKFDEVSWQRSSKLCKFLHRSQCQ